MMAPDPGPGELLDLETGAATVNESEGTISIDVLRTGGSVGTVTVDYLTTDGAATNPDDYTATTGTLTFVDGDTVETITVPIIDDSDEEVDEDFTVTIQNALGGATLGTTLATTVTISANDTPVLPGVLAFSTSEVTVDEDAGTVNIEVVRSGGSDGDVTVDYVTFQGTADSVDDFTPQSGTLTFVDSDVVETIVIPIINDTEVEADEEFGIAILFAGGERQ